MILKSKTGWILAGTYIVIALYLIFTQGLFGESFISLLLGLPWSLIPSFFEFGGASGGMLYFLILAPMAINALVLYWVGSLFGKKSSGI